MQILQSNLTVYTYIQREGTPDSGSEGRELEYTYDTSVEVFCNLYMGYIKQRQPWAGLHGPRQLRKRTRTDGEGSKKEIIILGSSNQAHPPSKGWPHFVSSVGLTASPFYGGTLSHTGR